ncbi:hypothetical protein ACOMHN_042892 [Nucella lapillus]
MASMSSLKDLMLKEQVLQSVSKELATFLRERDFKDLKELITSAERYREAHPGFVAPVAWSHAELSFLSPSLSFRSLLRFCLPEEVLHFC